MHVHSSQQTSGESARIVAIVSVRHRVAICAMHVAVEAVSSSSDRAGPVPVSPPMLLRSARRVTRCTPLDSIRQDGQSHNSTEQTQTTEWN